MNEHVELPAATPEQPAASDTAAYLRELLERLADTQAKLRARVEVLEGRSALLEANLEKARISTDINTASIKKLVDSVAAAASLEPRPPEPPPKRMPN